MFGKKLAIGTVIVAAVLVVATAVPAGGARTIAQPAAHTSATARGAVGETTPGWLNALRVRSEALNRKYGLDDGARKPASVATPAWLKALIVRSDALNRKYGLGDYARRPASVATPAWLKALIVRSDALNRKYGLGKYANAS